MRRPLLALAVTAAAAIGLAIAAPVASAQGDVVISDLAKLDLTVGTAGHVKLNDNGLKLQTDDTTANAKVAGFIAVNATLTQVAGSDDPSLKFNPTPPATAVPGFQLKVTSPSKGSWTLVGESVYGDKWWASETGCASCASLTIPWSAGGGSKYSATLDQWAAGVDDAKVTAIGFSLGSGVKGEGVLKSMSFLGTTYRFAGKPDATTPPPTTTTPPPSDNPPPPADTTPRFATCSEANAAGVFNITKGSPDYRPEMDSDHNGIACEHPTSGDGGNQVPDVPTAIDTGRA